ncbi:MAG: AIR synthase-related protein [Immundisolibacterales bacterium]|nr:AIR synthase-related protein [Immundisolibacterales bacterium]
MGERTPSAPLPAGKLAPDLLARLIETDLPPEVRLGPRVGEDACAIEVAAGTLIAATDPITLTGSGVGAHAVIVNANDVAVTGARPRWFLACVLLPEGSTETEAEALFAGMRRALDEVGAALVGGHTEVTAAVRQPLVVGQMLGMAGGRTVPTGGLRPGDALVQIGPAPVEGAAVLADLLPPERIESISAGTLEAARAALDTPGISVVEPALAAARAQAVALHDPTEGGLSAGLHEMAEASGVAIELDAESVAWFEPGVALCTAAGLDPWGTLASGALLAGFAPDQLDPALRKLASAGHAASVIGRAGAGSGVAFDSGTPLPRFERDELSRL